MQARKPLYAALAAVACAVPFTSVVAQDLPKVNWKMQSAFGSQLPHLGPPAQRFAKDIEEMSDGRFVIRFYEPGALIPALECFDAVSKGSVESCWTTPGFHTGKYPALAFFTTVPFGPQYGEFFAWKIFGNGNKLRNEIYEKHGLIAVDEFAEVEVPTLNPPTREELRKLCDTHRTKEKIIAALRERKW